MQIFSSSKLWANQSRSRFRSRARRAVATAAALTTISTSAVYATAEEPAPAPAPAAPGSVVSVAEASHLGAIIDKNAAAKAHTFRYTSTLQDGTPTEVSGTIFEPTAEWDGPGEAPTIAFAPGTRGQGDQCAPSVADEQVLGVDAARGSLNVNYEYPFFQAAAANGVRVVVTDYIGLGTPGVHSYVNHIEEGHALIDAARAALDLSGAGDDAPVGFAGYSQGGGAAAAAAELAGEYAPELNVKGTFAGAPPANLIDVIAAADGSAIAAVLAYSLNGMVERGPNLQRIIDDNFNDLGKAFLADSRESCIGDSILKWGFMTTDKLTKTGETFTQLVEREPELQDALNAQLLGTRRLNAPIFVANSPEDDVIPTAQSRQLALDHCAQGSEVQFESVPSTKVLPHSGTNHMLDMVEYYPSGLFYLLDRFRDVPAPSNCGEF